MAGPRAAAERAVGRVSSVAGNRDGGLAYVHGLPGGGRGRGPRPGRADRGPGAGCLVLCARDPRKAWMAAAGRRGDRRRRAPAGPEGRSRTRTPVPPHAGTAGPCRGAGGAGRRFRRGDRGRGPVAEGSAARPGAIRTPHGRPLPPRGTRDRAVSALRRCLAGRAARPGGSVGAAVRRGGAERGRSVSQGGGVASGQPDARGRGRGARGRGAGRPAAARAGGRRGNRVGHLLGPAGPTRRSVRLHVHRHLGGVLRGGGSAIRRQRRADRLPRAGHRKGSGGAGLRCARL